MWTAWEKEKSSQVVQFPIESMAKELMSHLRPEPMNEFLQEALQEGFTFHVLARYQSETTCIGLHGCTTKVAGGCWR